MHPDWARSVRDQCAAAGVPFFFKQWGAWAEVLPETRNLRKVGDPAPAAPVEARFVREGDALVLEDGRSYELTAALSAPAPYEGPSTPMRRVGKRAAGRLLDGREHNEFPT
jgi:hypothetical protein